MKPRGIDAAERERTIIERQVGHLVGLVDDLLDVSRITRGKSTSRTGRGAGRRRRQRGRNRQPPVSSSASTISTFAVSRRGCSIHGDKERLAQVVANLLTNAAKYTEPEIRLRSARAATRTRWSSAFRDNGIGIDPAMQASIFDVFTQARQALDRSQGGLGLGLPSQSRHAAGGRCRCSAKGRPRDHVHGSAAVCRNAARRVARARRVRGSRRQRPGPVASLIVDDNRDSAEMIAAALSALGYATHVAFDAPGALRVVQDLRFDVALLDIGLPVMSGYELGDR